MTEDPLRAIRERKIIEMSDSDCVAVLEGNYILLHTSTSIFIHPLLSLLQLFKLKVVSGQERHLFRYPYDSLPTILDQANVNSMAHIFSVPKQRASDSSIPKAIMHNTFAAKAIENHNV